MEEDEVVSVTTASESYATVGEPSADKALVVSSKGREGCEDQSGSSLHEGDVGCDGDGGDIMVEVLGSQVYVDGVGCEADAAGDLKEEVGHGKFDSNVEKEVGSTGQTAGEMQDFDGESGPSENAEALGIADKEAAMKCGEGTMAHENSIDDEGSVVNNSTSNMDSVLGGPKSDIKVEGSSGEQNQVLGVIEMVNVEHSESGLPEGEELTGRSIVYRVGDVNHEAGNVEEHPLATIELSTMKQVKKHVGRVREYSLNTGNEIAVCEILDGCVPSTEKDLISPTGLVHDPTVSDSFENPGSVINENQVTDGNGPTMSSKGDSLFCKSEVAENNPSNGNLNHSLEDQRLDVKTIGGGTGNCCNMCTGSESNSKSTAMENMVASKSSNEIVYKSLPFSVSDQNVHSDNDQLMKAGPVVETAEIDDSACVDPHFSIKKQQLSNSDSAQMGLKTSNPCSVDLENHVFIESSGCSESGDCGKSKAYLENEKLEINCRKKSYPDSSADEFKTLDEMDAAVINNKDVFAPNCKSNGDNALHGDDSVRGLESRVAVAHRGSETCGERTILEACSGDASAESKQLLKVEKESEGLVNIGGSDMETSSMQNQVADCGEAVALDVGLDSDVKIEEPSRTMAEDQGLKASMATWSTVKNNFVQEEPLSFSDQSVAVKEEISEEFSKSQVGVLGINNLGMHVCSQNDEKSDSLAVRGSNEKIDDDAHLDADPSVNSRLIVAGIDGLCGNMDHHETEVKFDAVDARTGKHHLEYAYVDSSSMVENVLILKKNLLVKAKTTSGSPEKGDIVISDASVVVEPLRIEQYTSAITGEITDIPQQKESILDEKQQKVVQLDMNKNPPVVKDLADQGAAEVSVSAIHYTVECRNAPGSATVHNEVVHNSFSSHVSVIYLEDGNKNLVGQAVSNNAHVKDADEPNDTHAGNMEIKSEFITPGTSALDIVPLNCWEGTEYSKSQDGDDMENTSLGNSDDERMGDKEGFHASECLEKGATFCSSQVNFSVVKYAGVEQIINADQSLCGHQVTHSEKHSSGSEHFSTIEVSFDTERFGCCTDQDSEHVSLDDVQLMESEEGPSGSGLLVNVGGYVVKQEDEIKDLTTDSDRPKSTKEIIIAKQGALRPDSEAVFSVSDLVWGKVRSHPWWPGQIFELSASSEMAVKHHRKDCYLVAYFGDQKFAWNDVSLLKPFCTNFSHIVKHNSSEAFQSAVGCALDEVSRRVELGLACSCIPEEFHNQIRYHTVKKSGMRQESTRLDGVDKSLSAESFEPAKLIDYIHELALFSCSGADELDLVIAKAQLLALSRFKGHGSLPEFQSCGVVEDDANSNAGGKVKSQKGSSHKRKHNLRDCMYPRKKERSIFNLMGNAPYPPDNEDKGSIVFAEVSLTASPSQGQSFKVAECTGRVLSPLIRCPSIGKCSSGRIDFEASDNEHDEMGRLIVPAESLSSVELLSQLDMAACAPGECCTFLNNIFSFFFDYRNYAVTSARENSWVDGRKRKSPLLMTGPRGTSEFEDMNDSYWTDRIIHSDEQPSRRGRKRRDGYQSASSKPEGCCLYGNYQLAAGRPTHDRSPTELILNFSEMGSVPAEMNLNNIFKRFGPLREFDTEVDMLSGRARVVFKRCSDAEVAFTSAGAFNIFGSAAVNYQLSYSPSPSFKSAPLAITGAREHLS